MNLMSILLCGLGSAGPNRSVIVSALLERRIGNSGIDKRFDLFTVVLLPLAVGSFEGGDIHFFHLEHCGHRALASFQVFALQELA